MTTIPSLASNPLRALACVTVGLAAMVAVSGASAQSRSFAYPSAAPGIQRQIVPVVMTRRAIPMPVIAVPTPAASNYLSFNGRYAQAPSTMPIPVQNAVIAGNNLQNKPYVHGGGHRSVNDYGYDCSGSVSFALIKAGLLNRPLSSKEFGAYGQAGPGRFITIYVKPGEHVFMAICGLRFDTSGGGDSEGPRWRPTPRNAAGFIVRHPFGL